MGKVQIWNYNEGEFIISGDIKIEEQAKKEVKLGVNINPVLKYKDAVDVVGCQMKIVYLLDGKQVMLYSGVLSIWVEGWMDFLATNPDDAEKVSFSAEAWKEALSFVRGLIYAKAQAQGQNLIAQHLLPPIEMDEFLAAVKVEKVEK